VRSPVTQMPKIAASGTKPATRTPAPTAVESQPASNEVGRTAADSGIPLREDLHAALTKAGLTFTADAVLRAELNLRNSELLIKAPKMLLISLQDPKLQPIASEVIGRRVSIRLEVGNVQHDTGSKEVKLPLAEGSDLRERALSHPGVKRFQELFPDAQIRTVRNLNE
jgi:hypothetical protein